MFFIQRVANAVTMMYNEEEQLTLMDLLTGRDSTHETDETKDEGQDDEEERQFLKKVYKAEDTISTNDQSRAEEAYTPSEVNF